MKALECALEKHSIFNTKARKTIVELNKICLNNVFTQQVNQLPKRTALQPVTITHFHWQILLYITSYRRLLVCQVRRTIAVHQLDNRIRNI